MSAAGDVGAAARQRLLVVAPFGGRVQGELQPRHLEAQARVRARAAALARWVSIVTMTTRTGTALIGRNGLWHRTASPR